MEKNLTRRKCPTHTPSQPSLQGDQTREQQWTWTGGGGYSCAEGGRVRRTDFHVKGESLSGPWGRVPVTATVAGGLREMPPTTPEGKKRRGRIVS